MTAAIIPPPPLGDERYDAWLAEFRERREVRPTLAAYGHLYGQCRYAAESLARSFPGELRVAHGYVGWLGDPNDPPEYADGSGHWWCVRVSDGAIVDPTACQFVPLHAPGADGGVGLGGYPAPSDYQEHDDARHGKLPNGKCVNCGGLCYGEWHSVCCEECDEAMRAVLETGR